MIPFLCFSHNVQFQDKYWTSKKYIKLFIDYSKWYPKFDVDNDFTQAFVKFQNNALLDSEAVKELKDEKIKLEIKKIEKFNKNLPFPLLKNYLDIKNIVISKNSSESSGLYIFIKIVFVILMIMIRNIYFHVL